jgi:hypothetical protein
MIGEKSLNRTYALCFAAVFGALTVGGFNRPDMSRRVLLLLSGPVFVAFYFVGRWIAVRDELNKKLPTSSKELRRKTEEFYDWLDSQGRPQPRR